MPYFLTFCAGIVGPKLKICSFSHSHECYCWFECWHFFPQFIGRINHSRIFIIGWTFHFKGQFAEKWKSSLQFTHAQIVLNFYECLSSVEHKTRYSQECCKKNIDIHSRKKKIQWKSMDVFSTFFRISSFIVKSDYLTKVDKHVVLKVDLKNNRFVDFT